MTARQPGRGWAYAGAVLGGAVSIAANTAHSYLPPANAPLGWRPPTGAVVGAVFWPVALAMAAEILARTRWPTGRRWAVLRFGGLLPVALVAAVVSYRHLSGLLTAYGEDQLTALIGPLAVDGLMVMATAALLASNHTSTHRATTDDDASALVAESAPPAEPTPAVEAATAAVVPMTRLRLPQVMQDTIRDTARRATEEGRTLTAEDIRTAVRVPEDMAARILADLQPVNGHTVTS